MKQTINFQKENGLIPVIIQDYQNGIVLMLGFMNEEALERTQKTGFVWFWSRAKKRLWQKGEISGNVLEVVSIVSDCDDDTLLIKARASGPTCHTGNKSCFTQTL